MEPQFNFTDFINALVFQIVEGDGVICFLSGCNVYREERIAHDSIYGNITGIYSNILVRKIFNGNFHVRSKGAFFQSSVGNLYGSIFKQYRCFLCALFAGLLLAGILRIG